MKIIDVIIAAINATIIGVLLNLNKADATVLYFIILMYMSLLELHKKVNNLKKDEKDDG